MSKRLISILIVVYFSLSLIENIHARGNDPLKAEIIDAMNDGASYASDVLLDENGKSRCDYNLIAGKWYPYEPAWHTGQVIYGLVEVYKITRNKKYLDAAKKAGDWWVSLEIKDHPKLKGMVKAIHGDYINDRIVFATVSDGTNGMFQLYRITGDDRYARIPTQAAAWMLKNMYVREHGVFYDSIDFETGEVIKVNSPFWNEKEKQELFDVSRPNNEGSLFKDVYEYTGDERYKQVFLELCESLVEKQGPEGLWMDYMPNHKQEGVGSFHPRFNLWYAESLLEGYDLTGDKRYLDAAKKTAAFYTKFQQDDGTIYYKNFIDGTFNENSVCGSAVSFAGIIWLRLLNNGVGDEFKTNIDRSLKWVLKNRYPDDHPDKNVAGAFFELRTRRKRGGLWLTMRDIATSFGLRFLADYYHYAFDESKAAEGK